MCKHSALLTKGDVRQIQLISLQGLLLQPAPVILYLPASLWWNNASVPREGGGRERERATERGIQRFLLLRSSVFCHRSRSDRARGPTQSCPYKQGELEACHRGKRERVGEGYRERERERETDLITQEYMKQVLTFSATANQSPAHQRVPPWEYIPPLIRIPFHSGINPPPPPLIRNFKICQASCAGRGGNVSRTYSDGGMEVGGGREKE